MANKKHDLQQTKGFFQVTGVVTGTKKDKFLVETTTKTGKAFRAVNFGVEFEKGKTIYISLNGMEQDKVYFNKRDEETKKTEVKDVSWSQRFSFSEEGWRLIGVNLGLTKGEDGKNVKATLTPFDACTYIEENLEDGMSVFIKGNVEYSTYTSNGTSKRSTKFVPTQISLLSKDIDLEDLDYEPQANFEQRIVFTGIDKDNDVFKVGAKIVNYGSVEDAEFVIRDSKLAGIFKKNLKPYYAIDVHGDIAVTEDVSEATDNEVWGVSSKMQTVNAPTHRDLVITGASPSSLDSDVYTEDMVLKTIKALKADVRAEQEWGTADNKASEDEEDEW